MSVKNRTFANHQENKQAAIAITEIVSKTIVRQAVERLPRNTGLSQWLRTKRLRAALRQVYPGFAAQYPEWVAVLFDQHFLLHSATPLVEHYRQQATLPAPVELATAWDRQLGPAAETVRRRRMAELVPVATNLLELVAVAL